MNTCTPEEYIVTTGVSDEEYYARVSKIEATLKQAVDRYTARSNRATGQTEYLHGARDAIREQTKTV